MDRQASIPATFWIVLSLLLGMGASSLRAQVLESPELVCATNALSGDVTLNWTIPDNPCGPFQAYEIYASTSPGGPYTLLGTVLTEAITSWVHLGADGITTTWYYYLVPVYNCPGWTASSSDTLDNRDPEPPVIDYVTVIPGGAELHWLPSPSPETWAYIIYRQVAGFSPIDTVLGRFNTVYLDLGAAISSQPETYSIAAMDSCRTLGLFANPAHNTIYLEGSLDPCGAWSLQWNPYGAWPNGIDHHEIWTAIDGAPPVMEASLPPDQFLYDLAVNDGDSVCVTVRAYRDDGVYSESNALCRKIRKTQPSAFVFIRNATMLNNSSALLEWYADPAASLQQYRIESSSSGSGFSTKKTEPFPTAPPPFLSWVDTPATPGTFYRVSHIDSCGSVLTSEPARTIKLRVSPGFSLINSLTWNRPDVTGSSLQGWDVYANDNGIWSLLTSLPPTATDYEDQVSDDDDGQRCYRVEVQFDLNLPELPVSESLTSRSNEVCVEQGGRLFVPNAIVPAGANPIFKPLILYGQEGSYQMQIMDRYGALIFESAEVNQGWDGTFKGNIVPGGNYVYLIRFTDINGKEIVESGNVVVVR